MAKNGTVLVVGVLAFLGACDQEAPSQQPDFPDEYDPEPAPPDIGRTSETRVRIVAGNITSGNQQSYEEPGIRIFRGIHPDVAMVQEFNYKTNSEADLRSFVDQAFGPEYTYQRETGAQIPNGIVSRYPIIDKGSWTDAQVSNRSFVWARIDVPGPVDLFAISVHLLSSGTAQRQAEAQALVEHIGSLPAGSYVVLGGDFNTGSRSEGAVNTLGQVLVTSGPYPVDTNNKEGTNASRAKPYDWVLPNPGLKGLETPVVIGGHTFSYGLVADTRVYAPIGELAPAQPSDSGAANMQHMAVVRDFNFPSDGTTASVTVTAPNGGESWTGGSTHDITWRAAGVTQVKVDVALDGTHWTTIAATASAQAGRLSWTVPSTASSAARVRVSNAIGGSPSDSSDAPFNVTLQQSPSKVFINELLINEPGADQNGEFVELVNTGDSSVDLSGWTIADSKVRRHIFKTGTTLGGHQSIVVYGAAAGIPGGVPNAIGSDRKSVV